MRKSSTMRVPAVMSAPFLLFAAAELAAQTAGRDGGWVPELPDAETFHLLRFETAPEGAAVLLDGRQVCERTPCSRNVPGGTHVVSFRLARYRQHGEEVVVSRSAAVTVKLEPLFGWITVTTGEPGLDVRLDGVSKGRTPFRKIEADEGRRSLVVSGPCHYEESVAVNVERGKESIVEIPVRPIEGALNVTAADEDGNAVDAEVFVDGKPAGAAPGVFKVSVCARELEVRHRGASVHRPLKPVEREVVRIDVTVPSAARGAEILTAGVTHNCVTMPGGAVKCWGERYGNAPETVARLGRVRSVSAGWSFTCAALASGVVKCWGYNDSGQLGNGTKTNSVDPVPARDLSSAVSVSAGHKHACAVTSGGRVFCWGDNSVGQIAAAKDVDIQICRLNSPCSQMPVQVTGLPHTTAVAAGGEHTCALLKDGTARCWGANAFGQLGDGGTEGSRAPVEVRGLSSAVAISAGMYHTCAVISDGTLRCWGLNDFSRLGVPHKEVETKKRRPKRGSSEEEKPRPEVCRHKDMDYPCSRAPLEVPRLPDVRSVSAGVDHTCALLADGSMTCWGKATDGRIGDGGTAIWSLPAPVKAGKAVAVAAGGVHTCALARDGSVACWGKDDHGVLGNDKKTGPDRCTVETDAERSTFTCAKLPVWVKGVGGR